MLPHRRRSTGHDGHAIAAGFATHLIAWHEAHTPIRLVSDVLATSFVARLTGDFFSGALGLIHFAALS